MPRASGEPQKGFRETPKWTQSEQKRTQGEPEGMQKGAQRVPKGSPKFPKGTSLDHLWHSGHHPGADMRESLILVNF